MYAWIWRRLPGGWQTKTATAAGLIIAIAAILWYAVFPVVEPKVQFDHGVVQTPTPSGSAKPGTTEPGGTIPGG